MTEKKRLHTLDALRGLAALAVVLWHWQHFFAIGGSWPAGWQQSAQPLFWLLKPFYIQGWAAVDLFFTLSGFVFFWLYSADIRTHRVGGWRFALLRFSRLYPLHFATLMAVVVLQGYYLVQTGTFFIYEENDWRHFLPQLLMAESWGYRMPQTFDGPGWSVSIEVLLYIVFFFTVRAGLKRRAHILIIALLGGLLLPFDEHIARGVIGFFMGGFVHSLWQAWRGQPRVHLLGRVTGMFALAAWAALAIALYTDNSWLAGGEGNNEFLAVFDYVLCPLTVLALALGQEGVISRRLAFLGDISYSTYMLHFPMQLVLAILAVQFSWDSAFFQTAAALALFYVALIGMGALSYFSFERPLQRLIRVRVQARLLAHLPVR